MYFRENLEGAKISLSLFWLKYFDIVECSKTQLCATVLRGNQNESDWLSPGCGFNLLGGHLHKIEPFSTSPRSTTWEPFESLRCGGRQHVFRSSVHNESCHVSSV